MPADPDSLNADQPQKEEAALAPVIDDVLGFDIDRVYTADELKSELEAAEETEESAG